MKIVGAFKSSWKLSGKQYLIDEYLMNRQTKKNQSNFNKGSLY